MSAWVVALGLSAGYLINKNLVMGSRLAESITTFNSAAKPATDGPPTREIRRVQRTLPDADKYQDMNLQDLASNDVKELTQVQAAAHQAVSAYESFEASPQIEGVYLHFDRGQ